MVPATSRSKPCLIANCQPLGSTRRSSNTGIPPTCSSFIRLVASSNRRGTTAIVSSRSSQRRTRRRRATSGSNPNANRTWRVPVSPTTASNSASVPSTGARRRSRSSAESGRSSTKPTGIMPGLRQPLEVVLEPVADLARADDQGRLPAHAQAPRPAPDGRPDRPPADQQHGREPELDRDQSRVGGVGRLELDRGGDDDRRGGGRARDRRRPVEAG